MYKIKNYPIVKQLYSYDCGVAVVQSMLLYYLEHNKYSDLIEELGTTEEKGTDPVKMFWTLKQHNVKCSRNPSDLKMVKDSVSNGYPAIALIQSKRGLFKSWFNTYDNGHYVTVIGYTSRSIIIADPANGKEVFIKNQDFLSRWHDEGYDNFSILTEGVI